MIGPKVREVHYDSPMGRSRHFGIVRAKSNGEHSWDLFYGAAWLARGYCPTERGALRMMNKEARSRGLTIRSSGLAGGSATTRRRRSST